MVRSTVLLHPIDCLVSELAKSLVLTGINLALYDCPLALVTPEDIAHNFLFSSLDLGLNKLKTAQHHLQQMNMLASV